ncbi:unnamed protein product [Darwinula stevensoni]|uniref:PPM-type phosphatase domain-containing protein n=1 Tax=Darwinula stevensoni TaxID=69355 RepID=A0A7R8X9X8_9CRUS|nr:unnamed protein product [Darwinula stevensoni]CAG0884950.1 unnamed protein product [Darwinula stevensoni]
MVRVSPGIFGTQRSIRFDSALQSVDEEQEEEEEDEEGEEEWKWNNTTGGWIHVESSQGTRSAFRVSLDLPTSGCSRFDVGPAVTVGDLCRLHGWPCLYLKVNGVHWRKLEEEERALEVQARHLSLLGHTNPMRTIYEGLREETGHIIAFTSRDPETGSKDFVCGVVGLLRGLAFPKWKPRFCLAFRNFLSIHSEVWDQTPAEVEDVVEVAPLRGCNFPLKITYVLPSRSNARSKVFLGFQTKDERTAWYNALNQGVQRSPEAVDLSGHGLDCLPEGLFQCPKLTSLDLSRNCLKDPPRGSGFPGRALGDLQQLQRLRTLSLSGNALEGFPESLSSLHRLAALDLSFNRIRSLPEDVGKLISLQELNLQSNQLETLPAGLSALSNLKRLCLNWNRFKEFPDVLQHLKSLEKLDLEGNELETILDFPSLESLKWLNASLNDLKGHLVLTQFSSLSYCDVSRNNLERLDLSQLTTLRTLVCDHNALQELLLNGLALECLLASHNGLRCVSILGPCGVLRELDLSRAVFILLDSSLTLHYASLSRKRNRLGSVPACLGTAGNLEVLDISWNSIKWLGLTDKPFWNGRHLRSLALHHNGLEALPEFHSDSGLREVDFHSNRVRTIPQSLFKLPNLWRINGSSNGIVNIEVSPDQVPCLMDLRLTGNALNGPSLAPLTHLMHLKSLHIAYNEIQRIPDESVSHSSLLLLDSDEAFHVSLVYGCSMMKSLVCLEEIVGSGNGLDRLPGSLSTLPSLRAVVAHSNRITNLPDLLSACNMEGYAERDLDNEALMRLQVLDVSFNALADVRFPTSVSSSMRMLDLSCNPQVAFDTRSLKTCCKGRSVHLVATSKGHCKTENVGSWAIGFAEYLPTSKKGSMCQIRVADFRPDTQMGTGSKSGPSGLESMLGIVDGRGNAKVAQQLSALIPNYLAEERLNPDTHKDYLKHTFLSVHREVHSLNGQSSGAGVTLCLVQMTPAGTIKVTTGNVGNSKAVVGTPSSAGDFKILTRDFTPGSNKDEMKRIHNLFSNGSLQPLGKVEEATRLVGSTHVGIIPDPHVSEALTPEEAIQKLDSRMEPMQGAKKLLDFARGHGCESELSILAVKIMFRARRGNNKESPIPEIQGCPVSLPPRLGVQDFEREQTRKSKRGSVRFRRTFPVWPTRSMEDLTVQQHEYESASSLYEEATCRSGCCDCSSCSSSSAEPTFDSGCGSSSVVSEEQLSTWKTRVRRRDAGELFNGQLQNHRRSLGQGHFTSARPDIMSRLRQSLPNLARSLCRGAANKNQQSRLDERRTKTPRVLKIRGPSGLRTGPIGPTRRPRVGSVELGPAIEFLVGSDRVGAIGLEEGKTTRAGPWRAEQTD